MCQGQSGNPQQGFGQSYGQAWPTTQSSAPQPFAAPPMAPSAAMQQAVPSQGGNMPAPAAPQMPQQSYPQQMPQQQTTPIQGPLGIPQRVPGPSQQGLLGGNMQGVLDEQRRRMGWGNM
jgi:hypothetical protein